MTAAPVLLALALAAAGGDEGRRLLFLAEDRPVCVVLHITDDGRPFEEGWSESIRALYTSLDRDGDGKLTAKEASAEAVGALVRLATGAAAPALGEFDSTPKDDVVSMEELSEALRPVLGPFRVQLQRLATGRTDRLFDHLDRDQDGALTRSELGAIVGSLRRLDLDDDELITPVELDPFDNPAVMARNEEAAERRARFTALPPVVEVAAGESSLRLARLLVRKYDRADADSPGRPDGKLSPDEFAIDEEAFRAADRNHDGRLDTDELRRFLAAAPTDLTLDVAVSRGSDGRAAVRAATGGVLAKGVDVRHLADGDLEVAVGRSRLDIRLDAGESVPEEARRSVLRRFKAADANKNGYLEGKELSALGAQGSPLAGLTDLLDRDGDGKLYPNEVTEFLDRQSAAARGRVIVAVSDQGRAIFRILDLNRDRRLSAREIASTVQRVISWDADGDGRVAADEIPYHFLVTVARGALFGLEGGAAGAAAPAMAAGPTSTGPEWFRQMDRNGDGDISRREFLGPRAQFSRLDRDKDGLIDADEATKAGAGR